jgi:hypothetical protein
MTTVWGKGQHPDLDDQGNLQPDALLTSTPAAVRDWERLYATNYEQAVAPFARRQAELPREIQVYVQGKQHSGPPAEGLRSYERDVAWAKQEYARRLGYERFVTDEELGRMSLAETDEVLDSRGQPKPGVLLWHTSRAVSIDDGMDQTARTELRNRR